MKLRRMVLAAIVLGGILVVILGIAGVFSSEEPAGPVAPAEPEPERAADLPDDIEPGQPVIEDYRVEGENWVLTGKRAQIDPEGGVELVAPELRGTQETSEGTQTVHVRANHGLYSSKTTKGENDAENRKADRSVEMSGRVVVEFKGGQDARLETEEIRIFLDKGIVRSDAHVRIQASTEAGDQEVSGVGLEMDRNTRIARLLRDVKMTISGASAVIPTGAQADEATATAEVIRIDADGPVVLDGFERSFTVENRVTLKQGETQLDARRVVVFFAADGRETEAEAEETGRVQGADIDRVLAEGDVRFTGPDGSGECDSLLHVPGEEHLLFKGHPAVLRQGANEIQAGRIEMDLVDGGVFVPVGGEVEFSMPVEGSATAKKGTVTWTTFMRFDDAKGESVCRGDVVFSYDNGAVKMGSDSLTVRFDKESKHLKECHGECYGESKVHLEGRIESLGRADGVNNAMGDEPVDAWSREMRYDPEAESLILRGEAELTQGARSLSGDSVALDVRKGTVQVTGSGSLSMETTNTESVGRLEAWWTGDMSFEGETGEAEFNRDAVLRYGRTRLAANRVTASIAEDKKNPLKELHATGDVELRDAGETEGSERVLTCEKLTVKPNVEDVSLQDVTAEGSVVVTEDDAEKQVSRRLEADTVTSVIATDDITADDALKHLHAKDHVVFVQGGNRGEGDEFDWNVAMGSGVLTGNPVTLTSGMSNVTGDRLDFDKEMGRVRMTSKTRVEATLVTSGGQENILGGWMEPSRAKN